MVQTWSAVGLDVEQLPAFDEVAFAESRRPRRGISTVLRVKDESSSLPWSLPPLLRATDEVILVDNASVDDTAEVARTVAEDLAMGGKLTVLRYPYAISRCGPEHLQTPPDSVHSLAYFNNWAFSHVRTSYALKWDGDMVLTDEGEGLLADFSWQVGQRHVNLRLPRHPLYVESDQVAYLDLGMHNVEHYGHPMAEGFGYVKAFEWEFLRFPQGTRNVNLPPGVCLELKYLDSDEFGHWTAPSAFATSSRTRRKRREYAVFQALLDGAWADLEHVHRIEAPEGRHVVPHVRDWLRTAPRPLVTDPGARGTT